MTLQTRVVNILTRPGDEWPIIAAEPATVAGICSGYVMVLAAIPAVGTLIGETVIGITLPVIGTYRVGLAQGLSTMVMSYVTALVATYVAAVVIQKLAPTFHSDTDLVQAFKIVAYSMTAPWVAGVLNISPALELLVVLAALYAIYLFYLGMTPVMKTPQDKVIPYMVVSAVVAIVVNVVLFGILGRLTAAFWPAPRVGL